MTEQLCPCGDRPASECDEEWGPECDLGNNEGHVRVAVLTSEQEAALQVKAVK